MLRKFIPPRIPDVGQQMNAILGFHKTPDDFYIHEVTEYAFYIYYVSQNSAIY